MRRVSVDEVNFRLNKLKENVSKINDKIEKNSDNNKKRFAFASDLGIKVDVLTNDIENVRDNLNKYNEKIDNIIEKYSKLEDQDIDESEYKLLSNILTFDDAKLKNISEMIDDNIDISTKEYINLFAVKANELIRNEELKNIDKNVIKLSKISLFEKITGKAKMKKALIENYNLKRVQTINKNYIPKDESLYEIVNIVNNCGYKSEDIDYFIERIVDEFKLDKPQNTALALKNESNKIPFFYNKEFLNKLNLENSMLSISINNSNNDKNKNISEYTIYKEMLKNNVNTLELFKFEEVI